MEILKREMEAELLQMAEVYPVVTVVGMRQSGKTTLVRTCFPNKLYFNLENLDDRKLAQDDPREFLHRCPEGAIIDEIQQVPELLSYIQVIVDEKKMMGMFILTGSHQFELHHQISQSLAGRTAILKLFPLSIHELTTNNIQEESNDYMLRGGFPKLYQVKLEPYKYYAHYCQTYLERDVRELIKVHDIVTFQQFMRLCASRVATGVNASDIASELGISSVTVKNWLSILEASYVIFRIPPFFENFGKRLVKTPKLYFSDVGLVCYLLGIESETQLQRDPLRGRLFENLVVLELVKARVNKGLEPQLFYYRDKQQLEVDVIFQKAHELVPIEIKSARTYNSDFSHALDKFLKLVPAGRVTKSYVVYGGEQEQQVKNVNLLNYRHAGNIILDPNCRI